MGNEVKDFEQHFSAQAKGFVPFSPGFTIVGKVGHSRHLTRKNPDEHKSGIVSISPAMAAVEAAEELIGGGKKTRRRKRVRRTTGKRKKKAYKKKKRVSSKPKRKRQSHSRKEAL